MNKYKQGKNPKSRNGFKKGVTLFKEEEHPCWKGDNVGYRAVHAWVSKWKGQPTTCEKCGRTNLTGRQIHWANIDHTYHKVLDDYIRLCRPCHGEYDNINNLRKRM